MTASVEIDQLIRSKRKTIALIVRPDGSLIVRAPQRASSQSIQEFVAKNIRWIEKKQAQVRAAAPPSPKKYLSGESFEFLGNAYPLEILQGGQKNVLLEDGKLKLAESARGRAGIVLERWYREQARGILKERVDFYARQHGFHYRRFGITSARTRWGSCSASGSLNFSWRLIQAPMEAVDYVVVHELVHTVFHDHSKKFWEKVEMIMPDYRQRRKWLKNNGHRLLV
jgi:predicted metal-dependent hydrolase